MQEKYDITGMSCAACSTRIEKSVSALSGMEECSVNLLKNSMTVNYNGDLLNSTQIIQAVEKAGYGASIQAKNQNHSVAGTPRTEATNTAKKEYELMKRRVIWSFIFTIPLFYLSMGRMLHWPLPDFFLGTENAMIYTAFRTYPGCR